MKALPLLLLLPLVALGDEIKPFDRLGECDDTRPAGKRWQLNRL
jgi:hypothetical protein